MSTTLTATDPISGRVYTRRTEADYRYVSLRDGKARWHLTRASADRGRGRVFPVDTPDGAPVAVDGSGVDAGAVCTITRHDGICGAVAVTSFTGRDGRRYHECAAHAV